MVGAKMSARPPGRHPVLPFMGGSPMTAPGIASGPSGRVAQREADPDYVRRGAAPARHVGASSRRPAVALPGRMEGRRVLLRRCIAVLPSHSGRRPPIVFGLIGRAGKRFGKPSRPSASGRRQCQCLSWPPRRRTRDAPHRSAHGQSDEDATAQPYGGLLPNGGAVGISAAGARVAPGRGCGAHLPRRRVRCVAAVRRARPSSRRRATR